MKRFNRVILLSLCFLPLIVATAMGAALKVHVAEFSITGAANKDELKAALPSLLASRLSSESVLAVDIPAAADLVVSGSYLGIGKVFSIDAVLRDAQGGVVLRSFVQGENQDDLIPAIGRLAKQLGQELAKRMEASAGGVAAAPQIPVPLPAAPPAPATVGISSAEKTKAIQVATKGTVIQSTDIIRADGSAKAKGGAPVTRLVGTMLGIAPARQLSGNERELYLAGKGFLRLYRMGAGLRQVDEVSFAEGETVLGVDSADLDGDGIPEAYVTIMSGESLVSQVWTSSDKGLTKVAEKLPYYFRAIALEGREKRLYAQQIGRQDDFFGKVCEVVKRDGGYELGTPITLPPNGNIYNFNRIVDSTGKKLVVLIDQDGYLRVHDEAGEILWTSGDRYGGSEVYFKRDEQSMLPLSMDRYRWRFIEQRLQVTDKQEIVVPRNSGLFVVGNNRSYTKNTVFAYAWNGAALDEEWRAKENQNYLADYFYDDKSKELVLLEVVKKEGIFDKGASSITVKKVE